MLAHDRAIQRDNFTRKRRFWCKTQKKITVINLSQKAQILAVLALGHSQAPPPRFLPHTLLGHSTQGEQAACDLRLGEQAQDVRLVFRSIYPSQQAHLPWGRAFNPGIMACGKKISSLFERISLQNAPFNLRVAEQAGVGRLAF